jgi:adenylosuccinate synthase
MLNGVTQLFMMKADVLNNFEEIKVCTHYKLKNGEETDMLPYDITTNSPTPIYKSFKGWNCGLENIDDFNHLPDELLSYISYLEATLEVPVSIISIGPGRNQTLIRNEVLA